jgi:signal peptidase I
MGTRRFFGAVVTLLIPGAGHFAVGRPWRGLAWYGVSLVSLLLLPVMAWMPLVFSLLLVRFGAAIDLYLLRHTRTVGWLRVVGLWVAALAVNFALMSGIRMYYLEAFTIPSSGMVPALQVGDRIFINKLADAGVGDVVVFENPCDPDVYYVQRIVAEAGDTVEVRCGALYVNGTAAPRELAGQCSYWDYEDSLQRAFEVSCSEWRETAGDTTYSIVHDARYPQRTDHFDALDFPDRELRECSDRRGRIVDGPIGEGPCAPSRHYIVPPDHVFVLGDNRANSSDSRVWGALPAANIKGVAFLVWWSSRPGGGIRWSRLDHAIR